MRFICLIILVFSFRAMAEEAGESETIGDELLPATKLVVDPQQAKTQSAGEAKPTESAPEKSEIKRAAAETDIPVLSPEKSEKKKDPSSITRLMITLGVFATALLAILFFIRRWSARRGSTRPNAKIRVLTQHALGAKKVSRLFKSRANQSCSASPIKISMC